MESFISPDAGSDKEVIKVASFAFDGCLAHDLYREAVKSAFEHNDEAYKAIENQKRISAILIEKNQKLLEIVAADAIQSRASKAILLNGSSKRQGINGDLHHADDGKGMFFHAQETLVKKLNAYSSDKVDGAFWCRDTYVLADSHNKRKPGDTYSAVTQNKVDNERQGFFADPSNFLMLYIQMHKIAFENQQMKIRFDFYTGDKIRNEQLFKFLDANKDLIPKNIKLRIRTHTGRGDDVKGQALLMPTIEDSPELQGEGGIEQDIQQAYYNLLKDEIGADGEFINEYRDILATFIAPVNALEADKIKAAEKLEAFKKSRKLLGEQLDIQIDNAAQAVNTQEELKELVAAIYTIKQLLPRHGADMQLTPEAKSFAESLDNFYLKVDAELTTTKNALKPEKHAANIPQCDAVAAANRMSRFLRSIEISARIVNEPEKVTAHIQNLADFSKEFTNNYRFRVFKDIAKGAGISFGTLILAGAIGGGIGFGVGFAIGGPAGAVAVGILGAIIAGAIAAAIGGSLAGALSGFSIYKKQRGRRESEAAEKDILEINSARALGWAAG